MFSFVGLLKANVTILITSHCNNKRFANIDLGDICCNRKAICTSAEGGALATAQGMMAVF